jgi:hypothetical protein
VLRPKQVKVGPHFYKVKFDKELSLLSGKSGLCGADTQLILVDAELGKTITKDTLFHEVLHAAVSQTSVDMEEVWNDDLEERLIYALSPIILGILRENPEFVQWLLEA